MFKQGLYSFIPSLKISRFVVATLWILGVAFVSIGIHLAQSPMPGAPAAGSRPSIGAFQSPLSTPTPSSSSPAVPVATQKPLVARITPANGSNDVSRFTPLTIEFNGQVDRAIIERGLDILPAIDGKFVWDDGWAAFVPDDGWEPATIYLVTLHDGKQLLAPRLHFSVAPAVESTTPPQNGAVNWDGEIKIGFHQPVDQASAEAALSIQPDVRGAFRWEGPSLIFDPEDEWTPGKHYTLELTPTLKTVDGKPALRSPFRLSFYTPREEGHISFGWGPKVQVVNPDGSRAIQFEASGNLHPIAVRLYTLTIEQFLDRYTSMFRGIGPIEDKHVRVDDLPVVREWRHTLALEPNEFSLRQELTLPADLPPGLYVLSLDHPQAGSDELIVLYTRDTLVLKQAEGQITAWASAIGGGSIADMSLRIYARDATLVAEGRTDAQGLFTTRVPLDPQPLIVVGERDGEITASGLSNEWEQNSWSWWWQPTPKTDRSQAYIYTDRPIYRPGQTIYVKVVTRYDNDAVYSRIPLEWDVIVRLRDARDNVIAEQTLHPNEYGTLNTSFALAEGGTVGTYHLEARIKDDVHRQAIQVEEYHKPEYEVTIHLGRDQVVNGEPVSVTVEAHTYFGAPAANVRVGLSTHLRQYEWWWYGDEEDGGLWSPLDAGRSGVTDAQGRWTVYLTPQNSNYDYNAYRHALPVLVEATLNDDNGQSVSAHAQIVVHEAGLGLSFSLPRHSYQPNQPIPISVLANTIDGEPRADQAVTAEVMGWADNDFNRVIAKAQGTTTSDGSATLTLKVDQQGWYELRVTGHDGQGRSSERTDWLWVYDPSQAAPWYGGDSAQLQISADRSRYAPGETAQLLIRTPVAGTALLTIERGKTRRAQIVQLTAPTTIVPLTLQADDAPNVYVAVNVYRPIDRADQQWSWQSIPEAQLLVASTSLSVSADDRRLNVAITSDRAIYAPREEATFDIQVTGADGLPAQAELSFALVDEAIYALSRDLTADPFEAFYAERADIVRTYNALQPTRYLPGGMGGGGGGGAEARADPRQNFPDTAYWNPSIVTDANGRATLTLRLPDSLTRWRAVVRAVTADEAPRVGQAVAAITTTQPIVIRPALPAQLIQGDRLSISVIVHNNTDAPRKTLVWIESNGLEVDSASSAGITQTVIISPNGSSVIGWPATASMLGNAIVTLRAQSGDEADAVQMTVPVALLAVPDVQSIVGEVTSSVEETITLPRGAIAEASALEISLSPSIAGSVLDGLAYLTGYPYGCVEQTMSRALPNAVVGRTYAVLGVDNPALAADLPRKVNAGLQRLYGFQHNDGGWGWWFDDSSDDYQTSYVLFGLAMTQQAGYTVDEGVIERGATYLKDRFASISDARVKAYALFALAIADRADLSVMQRFADDNAGQLDAFSLAGLAIALHESGDAARANTLVDRLVEAVTIENSRAYWDTGVEDGHYRQKTMSSSTRSTALALGALARIRPGDPLLPKVVRWMMAHRTAEGWGTTQETAYTVVGLTDYLRATNELASGSTYRVSVNGIAVGEGSIRADQMQATISVPAAQLRIGSNAVRIENAGAGAARLYYKITRRAAVAGSTDKPAGPIAVTRAYLDPKSGKPIGFVRVNDVVKVKLTVTLPDDSWYVAIEDPLPGGLAGLNEHLNTTSYAARAIYDDGAPDEFFYQKYGYNNKEVRDDRVVFFATHLPKRTYTFSYLARATQAGTFNALPAQVYLMYAPELWGRSNSAALTVHPANSQPPVQPLSTVND